MAKTVVLLGTLDTKGAEYAYLRDRLRLQDVDTLLVDVGTLEPPRTEPDIDRHEVAAEAGIDLDELVRDRDRGKAVSAMAACARVFGEAAPFCSASSSSASASRCRRASMNA